MHSLRKGDIVFLYHKGHGIVAAGQVKSGVKEDVPADAMYCDLKWLTPKPTKGKALKAMPVSQIRQVTGRNFWWAKTMKAPSLNKEDAAHLLEKLKRVLA